MVADKTAVPLRIVAQLHVCINLRNDATVPFQNIRKFIESCHIAGQAPTSRKSSSCFCHTIWTSSVAVGSSQKHNIIDFDVPISIDPEVRASCLAEQPTPQPLPHDTIDSILSFSTSGPLFEYKVVLEVTVYQGNFLNHLKLTTMMLFQSFTFRHHTPSKGDQTSPLLPACIGEIFIRPPTPDRPSHGLSTSLSAYRSPQNGVVRATSSDSEERNGICSVIAGATAGALYSADEDLCPFSMVDDTPQSTKKMTGEEKDEKDRNSIRNKNTKKATRGPATPHARILIPEVRQLTSFVWVWAPSLPLLTPLYRFTHQVMGEAVSRGPAAILCDR